MADETIYRCINEACGRPTPRPVNFCPWCGTAQAAAVPDAAPIVIPAAVVAAGAAATPSAPPATPATPAPEQAGPAAPPSATGFGRSGKEPAQPVVPPPPASPPSVPPHQEVPRPPLAAHPPQRSPIRLRWWLAALVLLWGAWLLATPSAKKLDRRIDAAIALAHECKAGDAQAELIALRKSSATPEQLQRLQQALNDEAAACTRRRQRGKAWNETSAAVESALAAANWEKARSRLQAFGKRWGEDDATRALEERVEAARREDIAHREHPLAVPPGAVGASAGGADGAGGPASPEDAAQSARNLIQSARRDLARGDYGAAADKMTLCLNMVDAGNRECRALKAQAEQEGRFQ